jgi:hypothetical protein
MAGRIFLKSWSKGSSIFAGARHARTHLTQRRTRICGTDGHRGSRSCEGECSCVQHFFEETAEYCGTRAATVVRLFKRKFAQLHTKQVEQPAAGRNSRLLTMGARSAVSPCRKESAPMYVTPSTLYRSRFPTLPGIDPTRVPPRVPLHLCRYWRWRAI